LINGTNVKYEATTLNVNLSYWCSSRLQRFSIHLETRTPSGRKIHFCTPCTIWCIFFVLSEKFAPQEVPSRTPWGVSTPNWERLI